MKVELIVFATKSPAWVEVMRNEYCVKLNGFFPFTVKMIKSPPANRESREVKRKLEAELLLKHVTSKDLLIIFDEAGKALKSSQEFAGQVTRWLESGKARLLFCIGGAYGFDDEVRRQSAGCISLSPLTMSHLVAQVVALEQLYRAMTIIKGLPYHNV
jgi:23S rRNA (pseudouridine1915-N3)-methyltransferase